METGLLSRKRGADFARNRRFESISLQQRVRRNRWLGNACGAGTMLHGAPTVHLGIKHSRAPLQAWAGSWLQRLAQLKGAHHHRAMTITEWILVLTAGAFLLAPVAALSLCPIEDREALLRDVIGTIPPGHASSQLICREGCSIR
jgi:hypothetical protein